MLNVKLLDPRAKAPTVNKPGEDLGYDLYAIETVELLPGVATKVRTGVACEASGFTVAPTPWGPKFAVAPMGLLIRDRSSMAAKGIIVTGGVIDAGYRGEIVVMLTALNPKAVIHAGIENAVRGSIPHAVLAGDKIAQMIPMPVLTGDYLNVVEELSASKRGADGFGSSGS